MPTLHIVAACSNRKRGTPSADRCLGALRDARDRVGEWVKATKVGEGDAHRVADLYVGNHWSTIRTLPDVAREAGWAPTLWVASAGLGLCHESEAFAPYSATFATGQDDSVVDPRSSESSLEQATRWWNAVNQARAGDGPRDLEARADLDPNASWLVIGSLAYVNAMSDDLQRAASRMNHPSRLVIVTTGESRATSLETHLVSARATLADQLRGPLTALHARLAKHILSHTTPDEWNVHAARACVEQLARSTNAKAPRAQRDAMTDAQVIDFVRDELGSGRRTSASQALRAFRASGRACEQRRFARLFTEARNQHGTD